MKKLAIAATLGLLLAAGLSRISAQDPEPSDEGWLPVADPLCTFFGPDHDQWVEALQRKTVRSKVTEEVARFLPRVEAAGEKVLTRKISGIIDKYIYEGLDQAGVAPAPFTNDWEFVRRVTLDLTGRIPTAEETLAFLRSTDPNKRTMLVEDLLAKPEWADKWTIWFADLYENNSFNDLAANRFIQGVVAFNKYLRESLASGKPYNQMARELIAAAGANSYQQGELNFLPGGVMGGGPIQDVFDKQTAVISEKFLGIAHMDCLLCHNGRGHLDSLSLWGYYTSRTQAWSIASFLSHTATVRVPVVQGQGNPYYWSLQDNVIIGRTNYTLDYRLNTTTGNRPARGAANSTTTVAPAYFTGETPQGGETYRQALGRMITSDPQFARAIVNYMWEYFFGIGLVTPSNQFDPLRLDPDHPPADCPLESNPCTLQPSHPRLLNELAQQFRDNGYNLKWLMRTIVNSQPYQFSSRYPGTWNPANERLFARKLVRRLWSEEIHDAITLSSSIPATYTNQNWDPQVVNWAMQLPEPLNTGGSARNLLDAFLRGNRDDARRNGDGSIAQALSLMNDPFVVNRVFSNDPNGLLARALLQPTNDSLVNMLYVNVLSRLPTQEEMTAALANLQINRTQEAQNLYWSLYNKVDFIFNY